MHQSNEIEWEGVPEYMRPSCINNFCAYRNISVLFNTDWKQYVFTDDVLKEIGATFSMNEETGDGMRRLTFKSEKHKLAFLVKYS
jgi:hypothetical protein